MRILKFVMYFCISSIFENFPISILEAMDYGNLVLTTKVGGIKDFVFDRHNGIFVASKQFRGNGRENGRNLQEHRTEGKDSRKRQKNLLNNITLTISQNGICNYITHYEISYFV